MSKISGYAVSLLTAILGMAYGAYAVWRSMDGTGGEMIYPLDDTYIHIAMAKTLAEHGIWGVAPDAYAFCSSSPLWTVVLALLIKICPSADIMPLIMSFACVGIISVLAERFISGFEKNAVRRIILVLFAGWLAPFAVLSGMGMEHALHALLAVSVVLAYLTPDRGVLLCALSFLATATRYESMFFLTPLAALLFFERKWKLAVSMMVSSALPILIYAAYAITNGGLLLPNSLLLKSSIHSLSDLFTAIVAACVKVTEMTVPMQLMLLCLSGIALSRGVPLRMRFASIAIAVATAGHLVLVPRFQFYRYEAYLLCAGAVLVIGGFAMVKWCPKPFWNSASEKVETVFRHIMTVLLCGFVLAGLNRGIRAFRDEIHAPGDIYRQQVQMTRLFASIPEQDRGPIALNDLGYMCLYSGAQVVDIWGLGTQRAANLHIAANGVFLPENIKTLFDEFDVKYAALFPEWFPMRFLPDTLKHVAILKNPKNIFCAHDEVWLYARDSKSAEILRKAAKEYQTRLPDGAKLYIMPGGGK